MPFRTILSALLDSCPGSIAAAFLDQEGESIEVATNGISREEARVYGAYAGIFLSRASRIGEGVLSTSTRRIKIDWDGGITLITEPLSDGYYVVLVTRRPFFEAVVLRQLRRAHTALRSEL